ncbi:MAG: DEAD/DEAH box helicase family protein [Lachnospiraceae bacterium]|nr:DEAD/DEAH box helicase family protein [Lachnospiraceae bacterium]
MNTVDRINWAMSLREPQGDALRCFAQISEQLEYKTSTKAEAEQIASVQCQNPHTIQVAKEFDFPSFCFSMATGIGKTRLMGAAIYYLYKTKGYKHFMILAPGNTIYDKLRAESAPSHPKYLFRGLEAEMGRPKVYDGENYLSYPVKYEQGELFVEKTSEVQLFIFNIGKIFTRGDVQFKFHVFNEDLGGSFSDVLRSFDDLVICMDEAHRYYAPASMNAINYLNPILGLEFTATPKNTNKNVIFEYGLAEGAGKYLKIPVVMGRTNAAGYTDADIEEMKLKDGIRLHERRKSIVYKYCVDNNLLQVKPIVLVACRDTGHAREVREKIDSDAFFGGRYIGKVIQIDSSTGSVETEENIQKLLTIEENTNPIEIVLHVYKLKEGWDVNNLFTIIPLNAAKSDILALQTIGRGLRLPFGTITGIEEIDTLDIVAHEHYREIVDDLRNNPVFRHRDLDTEDLPDMKQVSIQTSFDDYQLSFIDTAMQSEQIVSFQHLGEKDSQSVAALYNAYLQAYARKAEPKKEKADEFQQMSLTEMFGTEMGDVDNASKSAEGSSAEQDSPGSADHELTGKKAKPPALKKDEFVKRLEDMVRVAVSVPKIMIGHSSTVKFHPITVYRGIGDFEVAASKIERYDVVNDRLLSSVDAEALMEDDPENFLAAALLDEIPEFCADDADYILDVVEQYLKLIEGDFETRKKVVRRYATAIVEDLRKQIYAAKEEHTEFLYNVQKDLIVFGSGVKNIRKNNGVLHYTKEISDKRNIRQYVFEGYKKSYYSQNAFDSDDERRFSVILEEDDAVLRFIKPPLNQLGLFYKAGKQYNPDFIVETDDAKYMIEIKAANRTDDADVIDKAKSAIQWCSCATDVDTDHKPWHFKLVPGQEIIIGNTFKYVVGKAVPIRTEED